MNNNQFVTFESLKAIQDSSALNPYYVGQVIGNYRVIETKLVSFNDLIKLALDGKEVEEELFVAVHPLKPQEVFVCRVALVNDDGIVSFGM